MEKTSIAKKDKVQREALEAWVKAGKRGTLHIITGIGKTFCALHAIMTMPEGSRVLFAAEQINRKKTLVKEIEKYKEIFGVDVREHVQLIFECYQTVYKWNNVTIDLVIADEIHDSLTPEYVKFYTNNNIKCLLGLTATLKSRVQYTIGRSTVNKKILLDYWAKCPVVYTYSPRRAKLEQTSRKLNVYVLNINLNKEERSEYNKWERNIGRIRQEMAMLDRSDPNHEVLKEKLQFRYYASTRKRDKILTDSSTKTEVAKELVSKLNTKVLLFANSLDCLKKITPNVVSSKNKKKINEMLLDQFNTGAIQTLGNFKILKQGANLADDLDVLVLLSYYRSPGDFIQKVGRLRDNGKIGHVIILQVTNSDEIGRVVKMTSTTNYNTKYYSNIDSLISDYEASKESN